MFRNILAWSASNISGVRLKGGVLLIFEELNEREIGLLQKAGAGTRCPVGPQTRVEMTKLIFFIALFKPACKPYSLLL